jgi:putative toxin-antitoxin system antitoxin component (TIGR02293 family)
MTVAPITTKDPKNLLLQLFGLTNGDRLNVIEAVDAGLEVQAFERVASTLGIPERRLTELLRMTPSTLARRKRAGTLSVEEGERLYRIAFLIERALQVMGDLEVARGWLSTGKRALGGATPLAFAKTEPGAREVEDLLGRIEYGIPS